LDDQNAQIRPARPELHRFLDRKSFPLIEKYRPISAPETQHKSVCSISSDMFSLGLLVVAVFSPGGKGVIQAGHNPSTYFKQAGVVR